ncbi:unnamed protein product [Cyprideis torosa]|uniref:Uncharacterized protein n=1 Tax=Cyprideis torosa TaxID=163714 RepID=A0A7R8WPP4_9CRUS|nr:unnamed protein product [Cyprideis torosa]CAG0905881.1 unnamed protein product [Cyprideis torosa]
MKLGDQIKGGIGATEGRRATWTDRGTRGHRSRSGSPPAGRGKEYNPEKKAPLNDKVLKDKRKELKETLDPVMKLYSKEDPAQWAELRKKELRYEKRRLHMMRFFESVRHAQQVEVDSILLPSAVGTEGCGRWRTSLCHQPTSHCLRASSSDPTSH